MVIQEEENRKIVSAGMGRIEDKLKELGGIIEELKAEQLLPRIESGEVPVDFEPAVVEEKVIEVEDVPASSPKSLLEQVKSLGTKDLLESKVLPALVGTVVGMASMYVFR